ncbi:MAG: valine--tRNA ligase, partial [Candidatus Zixiibacteriota bacterium]
MTARVQSHTVDKRSDKKSARPYNPRDVEERLIERWEKAGYFKGDPGSSKQPYSIVIPPPNVTDVLHIGHALNNTIQDVLIRKHRMDEYECEWLPGSDHAGIATQVIVEKRLQEKGLTRRELGREKFLVETAEWAHKNKEIILNQLRRIGCSCDWSRTAFTLDEERSRAVREAFVRLFEKDLIYRGNRIVNWCPSCRTSLSEDEVEHVEQEGSLWYIKYKIAGADEFLTVATTRPETMLGDTALAVNPKDARFSRYIGKTAVLPLLDRELPIISDDYVDPEFGTGVVKITPAHDPNDFEVGARHELPQINVMTQEGRINENGGRFKGMDRYEARKEIVSALKKLKQLDKTEKHSNNVGTCYRCHTVIEPYLSEQWFVKMAPLAEPALRAFQENKIRFHPDYWGKTYLHWMKNIRDWCISRQLWWGHRIPIFYCDSCNAVTASVEQLTECAKCGSAEIRQDEDVLDTWFSSWLWPLSTMNWPRESEEFKFFYPTRVLSTASEIIFLWVARMIMAGYEFVGERPFSDIYIHGTVRDANGVKMSKSLGNGIDPLDIIKQFGADSLRVSLILSTPDGQDPWLSKNSFELGRNFVNKIFQAARFLQMRTPAEFDTSDVRLPARAELASPDLWILSKLQTTIENVQSSFESFRLSAALKSIYDFAWNDFCSWYIELIKPDTGQAPIQQESLRVAFYTLDKILKLMHPFAPFFTEELNESLRENKNGEATLVFGPWPLADESLKDRAAEEALDCIKSVVEGVRSLRAEMNVPPGKKCNLHVKVSERGFGALLESHQPYFRSLAKVERMVGGVDVKKPPLS